jgi:hypothetical protein
MFARRLCGGQCVSSEHQREVRKCLGEVPQLSLGHRIVFFGQQPHIVLKLEQVLE